MVRRLLYRIHRGIFGNAYRLSRRFTAAGKFALGCLMLAAGMGADTNLTTAYQAFTFLAVLLMASALWTICWPFRRGTINVSRTLPQFGTAGMPLSYDVTVKNQTASSLKGLVLFEDMEDPRPSWEEFSAAPVRRRQGMKAEFEDVVGLMRWQELVERKQPAVITSKPMSDLLPRDSVDVRVEFTPRRRGRVRLAGVTLARPDVFGMIFSHRRLPLPQSLLILPKRYSVPSIAMPGKREYQQSGVALASSVGQSDEFVALRDYRPGDPLRHIHWKSVAKSDRLIVREYEDEFFVRHALILDTFMPGREDEAFEEAVSLAASFVCTIRTQESLLDLLFVGPEAYCFTAGRGVGHVDRMLEILAGVGQCSEKKFETLESLVLRHASLVSGCVCVFLSWDEPRQRLVKKLRALRVPLRVCVVVPESKSDPLDLGPMKEEPHNFLELHPGKIQEGLAKW